MARPRIIPGKSVQASFSLSESDYELVRAEAALAGRSVSEWVRLAVLDKLEREKNG